MTDERGYYTFSMIVRLSLLLVNAIKEQQQIIESQQKENNQLKAEVKSKDNELENRIQHLEEHLKLVNQ